MIHVRSSAVVRWPLRKPGSLVRWPGFFASWPAGIRRFREYGLEREAVAELFAACTERFGIPSESSAA